MNNGRKKYFGNIKYVRECRTIIFGFEFTKSGITPSKSLPEIPKEAQSAGVPGNYTQILFSRLI